MFDHVLTADLSIWAGWSRINRRRHDQRRGLLAKAKEEQRSSCGRASSKSSNCNPTHNQKCNYKQNNKPHDSCIHSHKPCHSHEHDISHDHSHNHSHNRSTIMATTTMAETNHGHNQAQHHQHHHHDQHNDDTSTKDNCKKKREEQKEENNKKRIRKTTNHKLALLSPAPCTWPWLRDPLLYKVSGKFLLRHCSTVLCVAAVAWIVWGDAREACHAFSRPLFLDKRRATLAMSYRQLSPVAGIEQKHEAATSQTSGHREWRWRLCVRWGKLLSVFDLLLNVLLCQKLYKTCCMQLLLSALHVSSPWV